MHSTHRPLAARGAGVADVRPRAQPLANDMLALLALSGCAQVPVWAAQRCRELARARAARVIDVFPAGAARLKDVVAGEWTVKDSCAEDGAPPLPLRGDADLARAIDERRLVTARQADGTLRCLMPFAAAGEVRHVAEIEAARCGLETLAAMEALYAIASRYFDICAESETDALTRLANRRRFDDRVAARLARRGADQRCHFLAIADIDRFKRVNDRYGHLYGDEILIHFAQAMRTAFRADDLLFRFGGEEFVVVFAVDRAADGAAVLERFRASVEQYRFPGVERVTASVGYACIAHAAEALTTLIDRADHALYHAKKHGRNRVCGYEDLVARGALAAIEPASGEVTLF